jgi:hypothetical protein
MLREVPLSVYYRQSPAIRKVLHGLFQFLGEHSEKTVYTEHNLRTFQIFVNSSSRIGQSVTLQLK